MTDNNKTRVSAQSNLGTLTVLFQESVGGLEIDYPPESGNFDPVTPIPWMVIVDIADLMERSSHGRWHSATHRVGAPPVDPATKAEADYGKEILNARYSIPYFATADPEAVLIEAVSGCLQ